MAEKIIKSDDVIESDIFKDTRDSAILTIGELDKLENKLREFLRISKENAKGNDGGLAKGFDEQAEALYRVSEAYKANVTIKKQIISEEEKLRALINAETGSINELNTSLQSNKIARSEANKEAKQAAILAQAEEGSLEQLKVKLSQATKELDRMGEATRNSVIGKEQIQKVKDYSDAIGKVEQASGRFNRNVGNYKSGYNGLTASINQLTREAPAAAVSMNTLFLALSNNIPMFTDEITKLKNANIGLAESGKPTVSILGAIGSALFSWQTLISTAVTLLTFFGGAIVKWITGTSEDATKAQEALTKSLLESQKALEDWANKAYESGLKVSVALGFTTEQKAELVLNTRKMTHDLFSEYKRFSDERDLLNKSSNIKNFNLNQEYSKDEIAFFIKNGNLDKEEYEKYAKDKEKLIIKHNTIAADINKYYADQAILIANPPKKGGRGGSDNKEGKLVDPYELTSDEMFKTRLENAKERATILQTENNLALSNRNKTNEQYNEADLWIQKEYLDTKRALEVEYGISTIETDKAISELKKKEAQDYDKWVQDFITKSLKDIDDKIEKDRKAKLDKDKKNKEERIKREEDIFDAVKKLSDEYFAREEKAIDRSIDASKRRQDELKLLAAYGVDNAKESIAAEQKIQAEAEEKRMKLEKQKQKAEIALVAMKTFTANLEATGDAKKAFMQTSIEMAALVALVNGLPAFHSGTEDTGEGGGVDNKGGFHAILHPHERIFTEKQNSVIGNIDNNEAAKVLSMYNDGYLLPYTQIKAPMHGNSNIDVVNEIKSLKEAVNSIQFPSQRLEFNDIEKALIQTVETKTKVERNIFKPKTGIWYD